MGDRLLDAKVADTGRICCFVNTKADPAALAELTRDCGIVVSLQPMQPAPPHGHGRASCSPLCAPFAAGWAAAAKDRRKTKSQKGAATLYAVVIVPCTRRRSRLGHRQDPNLPWDGQQMVNLGWSASSSLTAAPYLDCELWAMRAGAGRVRRSRALSPRG